MEKALPPIPAKRYFTIGEVSELCGVKPYVLRYWEQEFTQLKPMPVMNGFAAAAAFRASAPGIILVALSGQLDEERKAQADAAGFDLCVLKGTGFRSLRLQIEALAEDGAARRRLPQFANA